MLPVSERSFFKTYFYSILIFDHFSASAMYLAQPFIEDTSNNHTEVGESLVLNCYLQKDINSVFFEWITPRGRFSVSFMYLTNIFNIQTVSL